MENPGDCQCATASAVEINDRGDTDRHYCTAESCKCGPSCANRLCDVRPKAVFEVYFVNPTLNFGVRTMDYIAEGSALFEYTGTLQMDRDLEDDEYIYFFRHVSIGVGRVGVMGEGISIF